MLEDYNICNVRSIDRLRNAIAKRKCRNKLKLLEKIDRKVQRWFGHFE